jgi:hypothetical protein
MERDPRTDPMPGDVIRGKYTTKRIEHVVAPWVLLMEVGSYGKDTIPEHGWRKSWEKIAAYRTFARAKSATVIRKAEDHG